MKKLFKNHQKIHQKLLKKILKKILEKFIQILEKIHQKLYKKSIKNYWKNHQKNSSKIIEKSPKIYERSPKKLKKNLPGLAINFFFPIKLKISTNLFSIKIKKKIFFLGLGEKNFIKNPKSQDWRARLDCPIILNFWADQLDDTTTI